jgi:hypothetical protein
MGEHETDLSATLAGIFTNFNGTYTATKRGEFLDY